MASPMLHSFSNGPCITASRSNFFTALTLSMNVRRGHVRISVTNTAVVGRRKLSADPSQLLPPVKITIFLQQTTFTNIEHVEEYCGLVNDSWKLFPEHRTACKNVTLRTCFQGTGDVSYSGYFFVRFQLIPLGTVNKCNMIIALPYTQRNTCKFIVSTELQTRRWLVLGFVLYFQFYNN